MDRTVTVSASATIHAKPDAARIQTGVVSQEATAQAALAANTKAMANIIDGLKSLGIEAKDIQTSNFNVSPRYNHNRNGRPPELVGYQVTNEVTSMIRDLGRLGDILSAAHAGAVGTGRVGHRYVINLQCRRAGQVIDATGSYLGDQ